MGRGRWVTHFALHIQGGQSRDTPQLVISHFYDGKVSQASFRGFQIVFRKDTKCGVTGYTGDHSIVYHFQLKHAVLVISRAKCAGVKWQESHFCQYRVMTKANQLIYSI